MAGLRCWMFTLTRDALANAQAAYMSPTKLGKVMSRRDEMKGWHWSVWTCTFVRNECKLTFEGLMNLRKISRSNCAIFHDFLTNVDSIWASGLVTNVCFYICTWQLVISSLVVHNVLGSVLPFFRTRLYNSLGCDSDHHFWLIVFLVRRHCTPSMTQQHLSPLSHIFNGVEIKIDQIKKSRCIYKRESTRISDGKIWNSSR